MTFVGPLLMCDRHCEKQKWLVQRSAKQHFKKDSSKRMYRPSEPIGKKSSYERSQKKEIENVFDKTSHEQSISGLRWMFFEQKLSKYFVMVDENVSGDFPFVFDTKWNNFTSNFIQFYRLALPPLPSIRAKRIKKEAECSSERKQKLMRYHQARNFPWDNSK